MILKFPGREKIGSCLTAGFKSFKAKDSIDLEKLINLSSQCFAEQSMKEEEIRERARLLFGSYLQSNKKVKTFHVSSCRELRAFLDNALINCAKEHSAREPNVLWM